MTSKAHIFRFATPHTEHPGTGNSACMQQLCETIKKLARNNATVLIQGETGAGKEVAAQKLHLESPRRHEPFIAINCGSIPNDLFESELFGHERGAFTGAMDPKPGKFELAHGGTLFLDEIGTMPKHLQVKLLRALQERSIERIGGTSPIRVDVRVIAATNMDLKKEVSKGAFREDLYHRLHVIPLTVPALRERREDIPGLIAHFFKEYCVRYENHFEGIDLKALKYLQDYRWPGNVRELKHMVERIVILEEGPYCTTAHLPSEVLLTCHRHYKGGSFNEIIDNVARDVLHTALSEHNGNYSQTARHLGLKRTTLVSKIKQYDLSPVCAV